MALIYIGALRFVGLQADFASLPIDVELTGAIFDATDTLNRYLFDGTNWQIAPDNIPLTTKGDLLTFDTGDVRLPVGGDGQILSSNSVIATGLEWITPSSFSSPLTTDGDIMIYNATDVRLGIGTLNQVLTVSAGGFPEWAVSQGSSPLTTKGDIFGFDTADARIPVGLDGQVLSSQSLETTGVKWVDLVAVKGDLLSFDTQPTQLAVGLDGQFLKVNSATVTGLEWSTEVFGDALTTQPLSQFASTTSAQLLGVISDETGSGLLTFATNPTLTGLTMAGNFVLGAFFESFDVITPPTDPPSGKARLYQKSVDANNQPLAVKFLVNAAITEVRFF